MKISTLCALLLTQAAVLPVLSGCMTTEREKQMQKDIFGLQTRVLQMEGRFAETSKASQAGEDANKQKIASFYTEFEKMQRDVSKMKGDIDALRIGVTTGQMPGAAEAPKEGTIASQLKDLSGRLDEVEASQEEILAVIKKGTAQTKAAQADTKSSKDSSSKDKTFKELKAAFDKKRYKEVAEEADKTLKKTKGAEKTELLYLYGESLFKLGRLREAALKYNDFIESGPSDQKAAVQAKMRMGDCFRHLNDKATAKIYYDEIVAQHPDSDEAKTAKERLAEMEKKK